MSPEEKARSIIYKAWAPEGPLTERTIFDIAQALRDAREDALEEAAKHLESQRTFSDGDPSDELAIYPTAMAQAIRSLKDKGGA